MRVLKENNDVTICPADKRGTIIVLDTEIYHRANIHMLADILTYRKLDSNPTSLFQQKLRRLVQEGVHLGVINLQQAEYIVIENPITAIFHSFPKVHKPGPPPPFQPIVAGIGSLNENMCGWVDKHLQHLISQIPGFLQDTKQVLQALDNKCWNESYLWLTADVSSLYSIIPHDKALIAGIWFLDTCSTYSNDLKF